MQRFKFGELADIWRRQRDVREGGSFSHCPIYQVPCQFHSALHCILSLTHHASAGMRLVISREHWSFPACLTI